MKIFEGVVQKGKRRGHALGFPTINIPLTDPELSGIFAARVYLNNDEAPYMAAAFADSSRGVLEAHLLDFEDDLYGIPVRIELHTKLRDSQQYESEDALKAAIAADVAKAREILKN